MFNIINTENKVNAKYKTKNIKTDGKEVFLATINQIRAKTISSRNFNPNETRLCSVRVSGTLLGPLKKKTRVIIAIIENIV